MKTIKKSMTVLVPIAAVALMSACSGGGDGGGTAALPTGGFVKEVAKESVSTWNNLPFSTSQMHEQQLVQASDIAGSGYIKSFAFRSVNTEPETSCPDITIKMGHTSLNELSATFASNVEEGKGSLQTVVDGSIIIPAIEAGDFFTVTLDEPFYYNGVDNLVMDFTTNQGCSNGISVKADGVTYANADVYTLTIANTTGARFDITQNVLLNFAGGVNMQVYGAGSGHSYPFNGSLVHLQHLYTVNDINGSGPVTGYALQMSNVSIEGNYTMTVKMGHTSSDALVASFADNSSDFKAIATDVTVNIPAGIAAGDWIWVPLNGSFNYNGTDNLVVDIELSVSSGVTNVVDAVAIGGNVRVYAAAGTATGSVDGYVNNAKFRFNGAPMSVIDPNAVGYGTLLNTTTNGTQAIYGAYALGTGAAINSIGLRVAGDVASDVTYTGANITMGHTTLSDLSSTLADNMDDAKVVFTGNITVPAGTKAGDWITLPVSGFTYDPTKNLTVQVLPGTSDTTTPLFFSGNGIISNTGSFAVGGTTITSFEGSRHPQLQLGLSK